MFQKRVNKLREVMKKDKIDVFFITRIADIAWLSGYDGSTAYIIITKDETRFITDGRYETYCREILSPFWKLEIVSTYIDFFAKTSEDYRSITLQKISPLHIYEHFNVESKVYIEKYDIMQELRMVKDKEEILLLQQEYDLAGQAFINSLTEWKYGQTELNWAATLEYHMKILGAKGPSFETIVASGVRGALPHGVASGKIVNSGEAVTIDFGSLRLYNSDYSRVIYGGKDKEILKIIDIVREALELAMDKVKPGIKAACLDRVAREHLDRQGYGKYFTHGLGHGVGMEVHELPSVSSRGETILKEGMVFTIEPGIYIPELYGVRLEQTVVVAETGCVLLSSMLNKYVYNLD